MKATNRREFLKKAALGSAAAVSAGWLWFNGQPLWNGFFIPASKALGYSGYAHASRGKEAMFFHKNANRSVNCLLCPHACRLNEGQTGICRVRTNRNGTLFSMVYGKPCSVNVGPIEKAPIYHFYPGHERLCVATVGCNLRCKYCHNWQISQSRPGQVREYDMPPEQIVGEALRQNLKSISFTYTEPTVFYEYIYDISKMAREQGLKTSIVSNGYINPQPLRKLLKHLDAVKIDLKAFNDDFYREIASARLNPVKQTLEVLRDEGAFFEIVNLVVPGLNDDPGEIKKMCVWIRENLGAETPIHFSRFSPTYKLTNLSPTPVSTLDKAIEIAKDAGLKYVYIGNVPGHRNNSTFCPGCKQRLVHRMHFSVLEQKIKNGNCAACGLAIPGIWET